MLDKKVAEDLREQLERTKSLLTSRDWEIWVNFLKKERRPYLQNKVNTAVRDGNLVQAQINLALFEDCVKMIELFVRTSKENESNLNTIEKGVN